jgi:carbamoyl-phosphate synthase large subunit
MAKLVAPLGEGSRDGVPAILDVIASGEVSLVVNTPSPRSGPVRDASAIRLAAVQEGILCLTSMDTAIEAARSLDPEVQGQVADVRPIDAWLAEGVPTPVV